MTARSDLLGPCASIFDHDEYGAAVLERATRSYNNIGVARCDAVCRSSSLSTSVCTLDALQICSARADILTVLIVRELL